MLSDIKINMFKNYITTYYFFNYQNYFKLIILSLHLNGVSTINKIVFNINYQHHNDRMAAKATRDGPKIRESTRDDPKIRESTRDGPKIRESPRNGPKIRESTRDGPKI